MHQFHSEVISTTSLQAKNIEEAIAKTERLSSSIRDLLQPEGNVDLVQSVTPGHTWKARRNTSAKQSHPGSFTWKEIEAALCIWLLVKGVNKVEWERRTYPLDQPYAKDMGAA